jgi:RimJ/RimL family protein N-acetyltransferase
MKDIPVVETERLLLRACRSDDLDPFAALNADAKVMSYIGIGETMRGGNAELLGQPVEVYVHHD